MCAQERRFKVSEDMRRMIKLMIHHKGGKPALDIASPGQSRSNTTGGLKACRAATTTSACAVETPEPHGRGLVCGCTGGPRRTGGVEAEVSLRNQLPP